MVLSSYAPYKPSNSLLDVIRFNELTIFNSYFNANNTLYFDDLKNNDINTYNLLIQCSDFDLFNKINYCKPKLIKFDSNDNPILNFMLSSIEPINKKDFGQEHTHFCDGNIPGGQSIVLHSLTRGQNFHKVNTDPLYQPSSFNQLIAIEYATCNRWYDYVIEYTTNA